MKDHTKRLLPIKEAAKYCGIPCSYFSSVCPAQPVKLYEKARPRYDIFDLDKWIDWIKSGSKQEVSDDDIANKL